MNEHAVETLAERLMKSPKVMQTVDKALVLLHYFSVSKPELGLSELARLAGHDKATTLRCLTALSRHGFVEQHPESKKYRLGVSLLHLARIREVSFPVTSLIQPIVDNLAVETGETSHVSMLSGSQLVTVAIAVPQRAIRVFLDPSEFLPMHATATGIAVLAHANSEQLQQIDPGDQLETFTDFTLTSQDELKKSIETTRSNGFAVSGQSYEKDVTGTAAPIWDRSGCVIGTVAVAAISSRFTRDHANLIRRKVLQAAADVTRELGGSDSQNLNRQRK